MPNANYCAFEEFVTPILEKIHDEQVGSLDLNTNRDFLFCFLFFVTAQLAQVIVGGAAFNNLYASYITACDAQRILGRKPRRADLDSVQVHRPLGPINRQRRVGVLLVPQEPNSGVLPGHYRRLGWGHALLPVLQAQRLQVGHRPGRAGAQRHCSEGARQRHGTSVIEGIDDLN